MIFKNIKIPKPTVEQISIMQVNSDGDLFIIAYDIENENNRVVYSVQNQIECIIFSKNNKNYCYVFKNSISNANAMFGTNYNEEGWYEVDFENLSATQFVGDLEISESELYDYGLCSPTYFCLLMKNYIPLQNQNAVKLLTNQKLCKSDLTVLPILQKKVVNENGVILPDDGYCGLERVTVDIPERIPILQDKTVIKNQIVTADSGYDGLRQVTVNVISGSAFNLNEIVEVESIENPQEDSPAMVRYQDQLYLLIKEN